MRLCDLERLLRTVEQVPVALHEPPPILVPEYEQVRKGFLEGLREYKRMKY